MNCWAAYYRPLNYRDYIPHGQKFISNGIINYIASVRYGMYVDMLKFRVDEVF